MSRTSCKRMRSFMASRRNQGRLWTPILLSSVQAFRHRRWRYFTRPPLQRWLTPIEPPSPRREQTQNCRRAKRIFLENISKPQGMPPSGYLELRQIDEGAKTWVQDYLRKNYNVNL